MRRLITNTFLTLDGVMQAPGGPEEDTSGDFASGGWSVNYWDDGMGRIIGDTMGHPFDLLLGRRTSDIFASYWPNATDQPGAKPLNDATKYVASRSRPDLTWSESVLIDGNVAEGVAQLKRQDGPELQVHGSANLLQTLIRDGLIDEFRLWFFPVVIGSGKRLFADGTVPAALKLVDSTISTTGVVYGVYEPAGEIVTGSFRSGPQGPSYELAARRQRAEGRQARLRCGLRDGLQRLPLPRLLTGGPVVRWEPHPTTPPWRFRCRSPRSDAKIRG
jgi:dihydrofolate reductase